MPWEEGPISIQLPQTLREHAKRPLIHPSTYQFIHPSIHSPAHPSFHPHIHLSTHSFNHPPTNHPSIFSSSHHLSIHPAIHPIPALRVRSQEEEATSWIVDWTLNRIAFRWNFWSVFSFVLTLSIVMCNANHLFALFFESKRRLEPEHWGQYRTATGFFGSSVDQIEYDILHCISVFYNNRRNLHFSADLIGTVMRFLNLNSQPTFLKKKKKKVDVQLSVIQVI